jgi:alpha-beta hydrolase superfamily lysophospholipase
MLRTLGRAAVALIVVAAAAILALVRFDLPAAELERRHATGASRFVDAAGLRVHVRDEGRGPALILIHGSMSSLFTWDGWAAELSRDLRVVRLDLPGHGLTGPDPRERYSPAAMAEVVVAVADALGWRASASPATPWVGASRWRWRSRTPSAWTG